MDSENDKPAAPSRGRQDYGPSLSSADDRIVPPVNGKILGRLIPGARLEVGPAGHLFLLARPVEMADFTAR